MRDEIFSILRANGFKRSGNTWREYNRAKYIVTKGRHGSTDFDYMRVIGYITEYLNV